MQTYRIYKNVKLGKNCKIGDFVVIGEPPRDKKDGELRTVIGDNAVIRSHTVIYAGNSIGNNFNTGHHVLIRENNEIGDDFSIGSFGEIAFNVKIGKNVKFHSGCHVYESTVIEDDVSLNPGVYVLNTRFPYRPGKKPDLEPVIIRKGAIITARAILMPGIIVGKYAFVGAGSLVNKDVPDYAIVYGRPAQVKKDIRDLKDAKGNPHYIFPKE
jgi:acetyltransferase-like isoleucine patch superfamily enzyme